MTQYEIEKFSEAIFNEIEDLIWKKRKNKIENYFSSPNHSKGERIAREVTEAVTEVNEIITNINKMIVDNDEFMSKYHIYTTVKLPLLDDPIIHSMCSLANIVKAQECSICGPSIEEIEASVVYEIQIGTPIKQIKDKLIKKYVEELDK